MTATLFDHTSSLFPCVQFRFSNFPFNLERQTTERTPGKMAEGRKSVKSSKQEFIASDFRDVRAAQ